MGATGTGKSATTAWLIERLQRPTLVMAPNKTLAAQLANELREMLPHNAVEYFVSYYDYYQPEAYIAQTDTYIEKDSSINDDVERLRHSATRRVERGRRRCRGSRAEPPQPSPGGAAASVAASHGAAAAPPSATPASLEAYSLGSRLRYSRSRFCEALSPSDRTRCRRTRPFV